MLLKEAADALNIENELVTIEGSTFHVSYLFDEDEIREIVDASARFTKDLVCGTISSNQDLVADKNGFSVYPNPCSDQMTINTHPGESYQVSIYDGTGRILLTQQYLNNTLDISSFESGRYYVELKNLNSGQLQTQAIFKLN